MTALQNSLAAKAAKLLQLSLKHIEPADEVRSVESQSAAEPTTSDNLLLVPGACDSSAKRAEVTGRCKDISSTPSTMAFLALLAEQDGFKIRSKVLIVEH